MVPPSLVDLAITTVYDYLDYYDEDLLKTCIGPVDQKMLEEVLGKAKDHYSKCYHREQNEKKHNDKIWAILPCLIKSKFRTELDFNYLTYTGCNCSTWPNSRFQEFIRCLGTNTPNLMELKIGGPIKFKHSLEERELASIVQLKNLTILEIIRVRAPLSGILDISRRCKKLKKITADTVAIDEVPASIPALVRDDFVNVHVEAKNLCHGLIFLHMETATPECDPYFSTRKCFIHLNDFPKKYRQFTWVLPFARKLQGIHIDCVFLENTADKVDFPHLPVIEFARIDCNSKSARALRCFLKRNGETLQVLHLSGIRSEENMTLGEIFSFCPNLQTLQLDDCNLSGNDAPVDAMQQLKRFWWRNLRYSPDVVAFSSILSAPLLEDLFINVYEIDFSDNATVISRIQSHKILQNLKKLKMDDRMKFTSESSEGDYYTYIKSFNDLKNAICSVIRV